MVKPSPSLGSICAAFQLNQNKLKTTNSSLCHHQGSATAELVRGHHQIKLGLWKILIEQIEAILWTQFNVDGDVDDDRYGGDGANEDDLMMADVDAVAEDVDYVEYHF